MDKAEYQSRLEELNSLVKHEDYEGALAVAESVDWRRVKSLRTLSMVADIYEANKRYDEAKKILLMAYDHSSMGKGILYRLVEVSIKMKDFDEAVDFYNEFEGVARNDNSKYLLKYKILRGQKAPIDEQIDVLEEYKEREFTERWSYELALLYSKKGDVEKCVDACDELILWFSEGKYVTKAMELKMKYEPLSPSQQKKYDARFQTRQEEERDADSLRVRMAEESGTKELAATREPEEKKVTSDNTVSVEQKQTAEEAKVETSEEKPYVESSPTYLGTTIDLHAELAKSIRDVFAFRGKKQEAVVEEEPEQEDAEQYEVKDLEPEDLKIKVNVSPDANTTIKTKPEPKKKASAKPAEQPQATTFEEPDLNTLFQETAEDLAAGYRELPESRVEDAETAERHAAEELGLDEEHPEVAAEQEVAEEPVEKESEEPAEETAEEKTAQLTESEAAEAEEPEEELSQEEAAELTEPEEVSEEQAAECTETEEVTDTETSTEPAAETVADDVQEPEEESPVEEAGNLFEETLEEAKNNQEAAEKTEEETPESAEQAEESESSEPEENTEMFSKPETEVLEMEESVLESNQENTSDDDDFVILEPEEINLEIPTEAKREQVSDATINMGVEKTTDATVQLIRSKIPEGTVAKSIEEVLRDETPEEARIRILNDTQPEKLNDEQKALFTYFAKVPGMDQQILDAMHGVYHYAGDRTSRHGNIAIMGGYGTGKTRLSEGLVRAICADLKLPATKMARMDASLLNKKDCAQIVSKLSGGFLLIERAGLMYPETIEKLSQAMDFRTDSLVLIIEDEKVSMRGLLRNYPEFAKKFETVISIPVFTNDELVTFARTYAKENGYKMDEMGVLALYTQIGNNQKEGEPMTISQVKEMVDRAIAHAEKGTRKFGRRMSRKHTDSDDRVILYEKDFDF